MKRIILFVFVFGALSSCRKSQPSARTSEIVLVHGENLDRCEMGKLIRAIADGGAHVIGVNFLFVNRTDNCDSVLQTAIAASNKVVLMQGYENNDRVVSHGMFGRYALSGLPGLIQNKGGITDHYYRVTNHMGGWEYSFPLQLALQYDIGKAPQLASKSTPNDYPIKFYNDSSDFKTLKPSDIISNHDVIKGKIVIIGYLGEGEENYFKTEQTEKSAQKTLGTVILANIILDILQDLDTPNVQVSKFSELIRKQQTTRRPY